MILAVLSISTKCATRNFNGAFRKSESQKEPTEPFKPMQKPDAVLVITSKQCATYNTAWSAERENVCQREPTTKTVADAHAARNPEGNVNGRASTTRAHGRRSNLQAHRAGRETRIIQ